MMLFIVALLTQPNHIEIVLFSVSIVVVSLHFSFHETLRTMGWTNDPVLHDCSHHGRISIPVAALSISVGSLPSIDTITHPLLEFWGDTGIPFPHGGILSKALLIFGHVSLYYKFGEY